MSSNSLSLLFPTPGTQILINPPLLITVCQLASLVNQSQWFVTYKNDPNTFKKKKINHYERANYCSVKYSALSSVCNQLDHFCLLTYLKNSEQVMKVNGSKQGNKRTECQSCQW